MHVQNVPYGQTHLKDFLQWLKTYALNKSSIYRIVLYGSFARGEATQGSDIDLAFELSDVDQWSTILMYIQENAHTLRGLDLVCLKNASDNLKEKIQKEGVVIFERPKNKAITPKL